MNHIENHHEIPRNVEVSIDHSIVIHIEQQNNQHWYIHHNLQRQIQIIEEICKFLVFAAVVHRMFKVADTSFIVMKNTKDNIEKHIVDKNNKRLKDAKYNRHDAQHDIDRTVVVIHIDAVNHEQHIMYTQQNVRDHAQFVLHQSVLLVQLVILPMDIIDHKDAAIIHAAG